MRIQETTPTEKRAMVIGITGSFGKAVAQELLARGWSLRALVRSPGEARKAFARDAAIAWIEGDALREEDVRRASEGATLIVDGFNVAYEHWDPLVLDSAQIVAEVAADKKLTVLFPGNVYGFGPDFSEPFDEKAPRDAPTAKGALRNAIEDRFLEASQKGAKVIILRCGDFFGPDLHGQNSWMSQIVEGALKGKKIVYPGPLDVPHQWAYLPDVAKSAVDLVEIGERLPAYASFHFGGHFVHPEELIEVIRDELDDAQRGVKGFPWRALGVLRYFSPMLRELMEMRYLWEEPVRLDGRLLEQTLGRVTHTPLREAIHATMEGMREVA